MKKSSLLNLIAGIIMIIVSLTNYLLNGDYISLAIFLFAGTGFIMLYIADRKKNNLSKRFKKYAGIFFSVSVIILLYWLFAGQLKII